MCQLCEVRELMEQGNIRDALIRLSTYNLAIDVGAMKDEDPNIETMLAVAEVKQAIVELGEVIMTIVQLDGATIN